MITLSIPSRKYFEWQASFTFPTPAGALNVGCSLNKVGCFEVYNFRDFIPILPGALGYKKCNP